MSDEEIEDEPDEQARAQALRDLVRESPLEAPAVLRKALRDPSPLVRFRAVSELDDLADPDSHEAVIPLLHDPDNDVRWIARRYVLDVDEERE